MSGSSDYTTTPNLGLYRPNYDMDDGTLGVHLNANADVLDSAVHALQGSTAGGPFLPLAGGAVSGALSVAGAVTGAGFTTLLAPYALTTALSTYLPLAGGTVTGATIFGSSVRHNGTVGFNNTAPIARPTGWGAATGTATRTTFLTSSVTLATLAEHVKALIDDLTAYGLIGP